MTTMINEIIVCHRSVAIPSANLVVEDGGRTAYQAGAAHVGNIIGCPCLARIAGKGAD
jgi:hypothetical protein